MQKSLTSVCGIVLLSFSVCAENWPQFRGPTGQGISTEQNVPLHWSTSSNLAWKAEIPGQSWSSPIVWEGRVFVTTATENGLLCHVVCLERQNGSVMWNKVVLEQEPRRKEGRNTFATPTAATDGERVYACFNDGSFVAVDWSGKVVWTNRDYKFYSQHGLGSSPLLYKGMLIMARDGSNEGEDKGLGWQRPWDQAYIIALDAQTGKERWKARRGLSRISHGMPVIWKGPEGQAQLVSEAGDVVQGFDPETGERLWSSEVVGEGKVPSTVTGDGLVFTAGGWGGKESIKAFKIGGQNDLKQSNLVWEQRKGMPKIPSMLYIRPHLFAVTETGVASCYNAESGEIVWQERLRATFSASPVAAAGRIYFVADTGETVVVKASPTFEILARNPLGEKTQASPAVAHGRIFIRGEKNVYALGGAN